MKTAVAQIEGVSPISLSKQIDPEQHPKREGESHDAFEQRTWREKAHYDLKTREAYLPGIMFKRSIDWTAGQLGMKIPGRRGKGWKSLLESGVMCPENAMLGVKVDDLESERLSCDANGKRGKASSGKVWRRFPLLKDWSCEVMFFVVDDQITEEVVYKHLVMAGKIDGIGKWRAGLGGQYGRYQVKDFSWDDEAAK